MKVKEDNQRTDDVAVEEDGPILEVTSEQLRKCKACFQTFKENQDFQKHMALCNGFWK